MLSASDPDAEYAFVYDNLGRVIQITQALAALTPPVTFTYQHDAAGRRTQLAARINSTNDFVNQYQYDNLGRLTHLTQAQQPGGKAVAEKRIDFAYDAASQLVTLTRYADLVGNQLVAQSEYGYDEAGRLISLSHLRGQTTFVEYAWSFDAAGRMTQYVNSIDGTANYTNDATGQLTAADYDYQDDESYQYDENGNRITANGSTYTTGTNNRLLSDGTYRYLYDAEGNRTAKFIDNNQNGQLDEGDTDITEYAWDHRNRLVKVEHRAGYATAVDRVIENAYDYANRSRPPATGRGRGRAHRPAPHLRLRRQPDRPGLLAEQLPKPPDWPPAAAVPLGPGGGPDFGGREVPLSPRVSRERFPARGQGSDSSRLKYQIPSPRRGRGWPSQRRGRVRGIVAGRTIWSNGR